MSQKVHGNYSDQDRARRLHKQARVRLCPECGALSTQKRWFYNELQRQQVQLMEKDVEETLCTGCALVRDKHAGGFIELLGHWHEPQRRDLADLIQHVADYSQHHNPANRILHLDERPEGVYLETTTHRLAEHIAHEVARAFPGELAMKWLPGGDEVRISYRTRVAAIAH